MTCDVKKAKKEELPHFILLLELCVVSVDLSKDSEALELFEDAEEAEIERLELQGIAFGKVIPELLKDMQMTDMQTVEADLTVEFLMNE